MKKIYFFGVILGARRVSEECLHLLSHRNHSCQIVSDEEAVRSIKLFLNDHRMLVEPACAASLALFYHEKYFTLTFLQSFISLFF